MSHQLFNYLKQAGATAIIARASGGQIVDLVGGLTGTMEAGAVGVKPLIKSAQCESIKLDGLGQYAKIANGGNAFDVQDPMSIMFWMNAENLGQDLVDVIEFGSATDGFRVLIDNMNLATREINVRFYQATVQSGVRTATGGFTPGQDHLITIVLDTTLTIYVDTTASTVSDTGSSVANTDSSSLYIGRRKQVSSPNYFPGQIGPVAIFSGTAISATQIAEVIRLAAMAAPRPGRGIGLDRRKWL